MARLLDGSQIRNYSRTPRTGICDSIFLHADCFLRAGGHFSRRQHEPWRSGDRFHDVCELGDVRGNGARHVRVWHVRCDRERAGPAALEARSAYAHRVLCSGQDGHDDDVRLHRNDYADPSCRVYRPCANHRRPISADHTPKCSRVAVVLRDRAFYRRPRIGEERPGLCESCLLADDAFGGLFYPLPKSIQPLEFISPAFYLNKLNLYVAGAQSMDALSFGTGPSSHATPVLCVAVLVIVTLLFG